MSPYKHEPLASTVAWDSDEQRTVFLTKCESDSTYHVERMLSVMNKPSQFVGRVSSYETAVQHWAEWEKWEEENPSTIKGLDKGPAVVDSDGRKGRPTTKDKEAIQKASEAWHIAVAGRKQAKLDWAEWQSKEIARIRQQTAAALEGWDDYVAQAKEELSRLQIGN